MSRQKISTFLAENDYTLQYKTNPDGTTETKVKSKGNQNIEKTLHEFLSEDVNESLHEMIRTNVLTATRNFQHRVETFRKEILYGKNNLYLVAESCAIRNDTVLVNCQRY